MGGGGCRIPSQVTSGQARPEEGLLLALLPASCVAQAGSTTSLGLRIRFCGRASRKADSRTWKHWCVC